MSKLIQRKTIYWKVGLPVSVILVVIFFLYIEIHHRFWEEVALGNVAYKKGEFGVAIRHYERAIKWHVPWSKASRFVIERLWQIGMIAEEREDMKLALAAYRAIRGSLYAARSLYIPHSDWILKSETKIANLMAKVNALTAGDQNPPRHDAKYFKESLQRDKGPHRGWSIVTEIGFIGWISAAIGLIWYIRDKDGIWSWRQGLIWGSGIFIFFIAWLIGMLFV